MLTEEQHDHIETLLSGLGSVKSKLTAKAAEFVEQMEDKFDQYGESLRLSKKQLDWLEGLHATYVEGCSSRD